MVSDESVHAIVPYEESIILFEGKLVCLIVQMGCTILLPKAKKEIMIVYLLHENSF